MSVVGCPISSAVRPASAPSEKKQRTSSGHHQGIPPGLLGTRAFISCLLLCCTRGRTTHQRIKDAALSHDGGMPAGGSMSEPLVGGRRHRRHLRSLFPFISGIGYRYRDYPQHNRFRLLQTRSNNATQHSGGVAPYDGVSSKRPAASRLSLNRPPPLSDAGDGAAAAAAADSWVRVPRKGPRSSSVLNAGGPGTCFDWM